MNTKKEVYKMLFKESKTELATQKIELASITDLKNAIKVANQISKQVDFELNEVKRYPSELRRIKNLINIQFEPNVKTLDKRIQDLGSIELVISKQIKELGINENDVKELQQAKQLRDELKNKMNELEVGIKEIKTAAKSIG